MTKRIILAVSGSISAYKAADLTSKLKKKGYDVHVIMTEAAQAFITPLTLQVLSKNPVHTDVMEEKLAERIKKCVGSFSWLQKFLMKFSRILEFLSNLRNEFSFFSSGVTV